MKPARVAKKPTRKRKTVAELFTAFETFTQMVREELRSHAQAEALGSTIASQSASQASQVTESTYSRSQAGLAHPYLALRGQSSASVGDIPSVSQAQLA
jgi:hypothetical protein